MESVQKICPKPICEQNPLVKIDLESTIAVERFACTKCGAIYTVPTRIGEAVQLAPAAMVGASVLGLVTTIIIAASGHHNSSHG